MIMEKEITFHQEIDKCYELLCRVKTLNSLTDVKLEITDLRSKLNNYPSDEYDYFATKAAFEAFEKAIEIVDNQISKLKN